MHLRTQSVVSVIKKKKKSSSFELTNEYKQKLLNTLFDKYCNVYGFKEINYYIKFEKLYKKTKIKKTKEEENAKEIKIKEKEKTKTEIKKAGSEKGESVFTSSSICGPSSGCISVESNAVMSQNVMGKTRDEGKIPSFQETATQTKKYIGQKVQGLIAKFESKENQDKNEGKASLTRSSTLWK